MKNTPSTRSTSTAVSRPRQVLAHVRDDLRERRIARRNFRALSRELASYNTRAEVDDLLAAVDNQPGAEADQIRLILHRNLARRESHRLLAS